MEARTEGAGMLNSEVRALSLGQAMGILSQFEEEEE